MKQSIKAALLSALILPGVGQISLGYKKRGWIIILLCGLFMFLLINIIIQQAQSIIEKMQNAGIAINVESVSRQTSELVTFSDNSSLNILLILIILIWFFSVVDAYLLGKKINKD